MSESAGGNAEPLPVQDRPGRDGRIAVQGGPHPRLHRGQGRPQDEQVGRQRTGRGRTAVDARSGCLPMVARVRWPAARAPGARGRRAVGSRRPSRCGHSPRPLPVAGPRPPRDPRRPDETGLRVFEPGQSSQHQTVLCAAQAFRPDRHGSGFCTNQEDTTGFVSSKFEFRNPK